MTKFALLATLLSAATFQAASAQVAPTLGTAQSFAVLGGSTVANTGPTIITGDLGVNPSTAITGFPPGIVTGGTIHAADAVALQAKNDLDTAYNNLDGQGCTQSFPDVSDLGGLTLGPGVYCSAGSFFLTGTLTLDAQFNPNAVWIFKTTASTLITASNSTVNVINGGQNCNVFWKVGSSATLGTGTTFIGNILALASISLNSGAIVSGRALARNAAVTMDTNTVSITACAVPPVGPVPPTLSKAFSPATVNVTGTLPDTSTLTITLSNPDPTAPATGASLTDTLPTNVTVAGSASTTCGSGTVSTTSGSVTLTGGTINPGSSCTVTVPVTSAVAGTYINSLIVGALQTSNGSNAAPAVATLIVTAPASVPPTLGKAFSPATINVTGTLPDTSTLTITLTNPSSTAASLTASFTDTLPTGVTVAGIASTTCVNGTVSTTSGSVTLALGASIPGNSSCTVTVPVTAAIAGSYFNTLIAGSLITSNGSNGLPAEATLVVLPVNLPPVPTVSKAFSPAAISAGGTSTVIITLSNPSATSSAAINSFTDILPLGVVIATPANASTTCPGAVSTTSVSVTLTGGGSLPASGSCTVNVDVTAAVAGNYTNTLGAASAILQVLPQPTPGLSLTKTANPTTYTRKGQVIVYTFVLRNTGNVTLTGPFTVNDDKLGSFACGTATSLAPGASITCTRNYTIQASDLGNVVSLPTGVIANINTGLWEAGHNSTQDETITNAGAGVPNGVYPCWCIQDHVLDDLHNQPGTLFSTIGGGLPLDVASLPWDKINYVLNHKIHGSGRTNQQFFEDVQTAIWFFIGDPNPSFVVNKWAKQMINQATLNSGFIPAVEDNVAVIVYSDGMTIFPGSIQESICEMKRFQTIVNHATASGTFGSVVVQSGQVQATVRQVR